MKKILVNIPALNESKTIGKIISEIPKTLFNIPVDILVVNDGSTDNTAEIAKEAGAKYIISHNFNKGVGEAFKTASKKMLEENYDILVNIDADGQFNPKDIQKLVGAIIIHKYDIVVASRFSGYKSSNMPVFKSILNKLISFKVGLLIGHKIEDLTCGFRAYSRNSILKLNLIESFTYTQEAIISGIGKGLRIKYIPIKVKYFKNRKSRVVNSIISYINKSTMIILRTVRDMRPLMFFGIPSLFITSLGILFGLIFIYLYLSTFKTTPYRTLFFLSIFLFTIGIQMFFFALMADKMKTHRIISEEMMTMMKEMRYNGK